MILGTAGHIDHGKTALVQALTGVDTDRLPEEKRRGITIDLGFAPLELADGSAVGVVDVPGHEAFVRTMLAGATGIDLALLVIAADEGTMPQTREHLAILRLLDVPRMIVALTKVDLVEPDWVLLVREEIRALLAPTRYADSEIVETSAVSGAGIEELRAAIAAAARQSSRGAGDDLFRMPVDRAFTVKGTGTVVTGTVWSGGLRVDDTVRILPTGITARVRALQSHGAALTSMAPGIRAAVALAGIEKNEVGRGATLVSDPSWQPTLVLRADVTLLPDAPELRPRTRVRFHLATMDVSARVVAPGGPVQPDEQRAVRVVLDEPIVARSGDRFVLRSPSPLATIGGGVVTDASAPRRARTMVPRSLPLAKRLELFVDESGMHGIPTSSLSVRLGVAPGAAAELVNGSLRRVGDRLFSAAVLHTAREKVLRAVRSFHQQHPMETGVAREEIRSRLGIDPALFDELVGSLAAERLLEADRSQLRAPGKSAQLTADQARISSELAGVLQSAASEPPSVGELQQRFGKEALSILKHLERQGRIVQVEDGRFYATEAVSDLLARLEQGMAGKGPMAPTQLRELLGFSRKFLIPFLEYCDRKGYTVREGNGRVWKGRPKT